MKRITRLAAGVISCALPAVAQADSPAGVARSHIAGQVARTGSRQGSTAANSAANATTNSAITSITSTSSAASTRLIAQANDSATPSTSGSLNAKARATKEAAAVPPNSGAAQAATPSPVEVPIKLREGDLMAQLRVNGSEPLWFKVDTGFGITTIHPEVAEKLELTPTGSMTIVGIAGEERARTYRGVTFDFSGTTYEPRRVAALPSETRRRWRPRDGILGASFFRRFVVEIDLSKRVMRLYEPSNFEYAGAGEILPLEFKRDTPIIEGTLKIPGHEPIAARLEIDTGCDDAVCLGHEFVTANQLIAPGHSENPEFKRGVGGAAKIQSGHVSELRLGKLVVRKPTSNYFLEGSPAGNGQAGHIGIGALKSFRIIFDYARKRMILEDR